VESYLHFPNTSSWRGDQLRKLRDKFRFNLLATQPCVHITPVRGYIRFVINTLMFSFVLYPYFNWIILKSVHVKLLFIWVNWP